MIAAFLIATAVAVYCACRYLTQQAKPRHVHRPIVVQDGTVNICAACGERLVNW